VLLNGLPRWSEETPPEKRAQGGRTNADERAYSLYIEARLIMYPRQGVWTARDGDDWGSSVRPASPQPAEAPATALKHSKERTMGLGRPTPRILWRALWTVVALCGEDIRACCEWAPCQHPAIASFNHDTHGLVDETFLSITQVCPRATPRRAAAPCRPPMTQRALVSWPRPSPTSHREPQEEVAPSASRQPTQPISWQPTCWSRSASASRCAEPA
jgi:hypothetical protein